MQYLFYTHIRIFYEIQYKRKSSQRHHINLARIALVP